MRVLESEHCLYADVHCGMVAKAGPPKKILRETGSHLLIPVIRLSWVNFILLLQTDLFNVSTGGTTMLGI